MPSFETQKENSLKVQLVEVKALAASRVITTQEGIMLVGHLVRLIETLIDGKPTTPPPGQHHR